MLDPGPDFGKTPAQTIEVLRALRDLHEFGRPLLLAVSRKDFVGAITGRGPRDRLAGTLAAIGYGVDAGAHVLRVHDVAAAADYLAVHAVLNDGAQIESELRLSDELRWEPQLDGDRQRGRTVSSRRAARPRRPRGTLDSRLQSPVAGPTRPEPTDDAKESRMSVLDRTALEASPLADLHAIASELSIDGYRRLRRAELIDAILDKQEGTESSVPSPRRAGEHGAIGADARTSRSRSHRCEQDAAGPHRVIGAERRRDEPRGGGALDHSAPPRPAWRSRTLRPAAAEDEAEADDEEREPESPAPPKAEQPSDDDEHADRGSGDDELVDGVVELLANGSGFVRVAPPDPSDDDVYISAAQVKRCELVSGDRIKGPKRAPRRSERFASLIRIDTINDRPASELADSVRFDDLPAAFPNEQLASGSDDATLKAIDWLTPFGKGSRVTIVGEARSGKSHTLRQLAEALSERDGLSVQVVLAGVRPEEISEWAQGKVTPTAALSFAASEDAQNGVIEPVIDQARRLAARGSDAVVLIDSLDGCSPQMAPQGARLGAQHRRRRFVDVDRDRVGADRRRDDRDRARR